MSGRRRRKRSSARALHYGRYYGVRRLRVTVVCRCGWVSEHHRSRGEAKRAYDGHVWLSEPNGAIPLTWMP